VYNLMLMRMARSLGSEFVPTWEGKSAAHKLLVGVAMAATSLERKAPLAYKDRLLVGLVGVAMAATSLDRKARLAYKDRLLSPIVVLLPLELQWRKDCLELELDLELVQSRRTHCGLEEFELHESSSSTLLRWPLGWSPCCPWHRSSQTRGNLGSTPFRSHVMFPPNVPSNLASER
jgi:hypothetical protein